jgi:hypothetical protein
VYVFVNNNNEIFYPYSAELLRKDNPTTSFPAEMSNEFLEKWNVFLVEMDSKPSVDHTKNVIEITPLLVDGVWLSQWEIVDATEYEIEQRIINRSNEIRVIRNRLLSETDWIVTQCLETNTSIPDEWLHYRKILRNIPQQAEFPWNVVIPAAPGVTNEQSDCVI